MTRYEVGIPNAACTKNKQNKNPAPPYIYIYRYADDPWLWELDWSVQDVRTKKLKTPKTKRRSKVKTCITLDEKSPAVNEGSTEEAIAELVGKHEVPDDNNIEVVDGLKGSSDILATIPSAVDVMYKRRQNLPGYPK